MEEHKKHEYKLKFSVVTVSSTRTEKDDESGKIIMEIIKKNGHEVKNYTIVKDNVTEIREALLNFSKKSDVIIFNGGTGISKYDLTPEALSPYLKIIPGFGEIFRLLSYQEIGVTAMMSRAIAGIFDGKVIFAIPGSPKACQLATEKIIMKEINHIWYEINKE
ncbi:MAG: MogA/MoaB family molybdenum cofactor biosynthesis protein [Thermoplasmata archaeon]